ncbi:MAG: hypothetical protein M1130_11530 [Actinobacteria bacterium]|nr:hypothetical protein [Actinomycetota bacterium]
MRPAIPVAIDAALRDFKNLIKIETDANKRLNMIALITFLNVLKRDWDTIASSRVEEIEVMSSLLKRGAELAPEQLRQSLTEAVSQAEQNRGDLRMSTLDTTIDRLKIALIDLQIWLESNSTEEGQALHAELYSFLKSKASRLAVLRKMW